MTTTHPGAASAGDDPDREAETGGRAGEPLIALRGAALWVGGRARFAGTSWVLRRGEHWAVVGPTGSGKSLFLAALCGQVPVVGGGIRYRSGDGAERGWCEEGSVVRVGADEQRRLIEALAAFHQGRWHASEEGTGETVEELLTRRSVESIHPSQALAPGDDPSLFERRRASAVRAFGLAPILGRRVVQLSNGELRKLLLARAVARGPRVLLLDEPFAGLDVAFRETLRASLDAMAGSGISLVVATSRPEDLPACVRHVLRVDGERASVEPDRAGPAAASGPAPRADPGEPVAPIAAGEEVLVDLREVTVRYQGVTALDRVSLRVARGEHWWIAGPNGAGKSTLLSLVLADNPQAYANHVEVFGRRRGGGDSIWEVKERIGWVSPEIHATHPSGVRVLDVVASGFFGSMGVHAALGEAREARARAWLARLLPVDPERTLAELSFGMQRLVFVARALVGEPPLLVLDEPCQGLDPAARARVLDALDEALAAGRSTLLYVTHQADEVPRAVSHVLELQGGRVVRSGPR